MELKEKKNIEIIILENDYFLDLLKIKVRNTKKGRKFRELTISCF